MATNTKQIALCHGSYESEQVKIFRHLLNKAVDEYKSKLLISALATYSQCLQMLNDIRDERYHDYVYVIKYITAVSLAESSQLKNLTEALTILKELEEKYSDKLPTLYATLGLVHYKLYNFDLAKEAVKKGIEVLAKNTKIEKLYFPESDMVIEITVEENYQKNILELQSKCDGWHQPDAQCSLRECQNVTPLHTKPRREIFFGDPAFNGMVIVTCSNANNPCTVKYHIPCWKFVKDQISPDMKISEKNVIGMSCFTPNCEYNGQSVIATIDIIGQDGNVKSSIKLNPKANPSMAVAPKGAIKKQPSVQENQPSKPSTSNRPVQKAFRRIPHTNQTQDHTTQTPESASEKTDVSTIKEKMEILRLAKFGIPESMTWKPNEPFYGNPQLYNARKARDFTFADSEMKPRQQFIFSYFTEFIEKNAPTKIEDVVKHWESFSREIDKPDNALCHMDIINFLTQSVMFVIVGNYIGTQRCITKLYETELENAKNIQDTVVVEEVPNEEELLIEEFFDVIKDSKNVNASTEKSAPKPVEELEESDNESYQTPESDKRSKQNVKQPQNPEVYMSDDGSDSESTVEVIVQKPKVQKKPTKKQAKKQPPPPKPQKMVFEQLMRETDEYTKLLKVSQDYEKRLTEMSKEIEDKNDCVTALTHENQKLEEAKLSKDRMISMYQSEYAELESQNNNLRKNPEKKEHMLTRVLDAEKEVRQSYRKALFCEQYKGSKKIISSYIAQCLMALDVIKNINKITKSLIGRSLINSTEWANSLKQFENIRKELESMDVSNMNAESIPYNELSTITNNVPQPPTVTLAETVRTAFSQFIAQMCSMPMNQNLNISQNIRPQQVNMLQPPMMQMPNVYPRQFTVPPPPVHQMHQMPPYHQMHRPPPLPIMPNVPNTPNFSPVPNGQQLNWSHLTDSDSTKLNLFDFNTELLDSARSEDGSVSSKADSIGKVEKDVRGEMRDGEKKSVESALSSLQALTAQLNGDSRLELKDATALEQRENSNLSRSSNYGSAQSVLSLNGERTNEELMAQKKLRGECIQLEDVLAQLRKEYEMLRIEFEQNLVANEQTGPINREMRHLITSLQNHNNQLKGKVQRYKRKYKESSTEIPRLKKEIQELTAKLGQQMAQENKEGNNSDGSGKEEDTSNSLPGSTQVKEESGIVIKREGEEEVETIDVGEGENKVAADGTANCQAVKKEKDIKREKENKKEAVKTEHRDPAHRTKDAKNAEPEYVRELRAQLKKAVNESKEMKLLLDMYKGVGKEQRDKVMLMAAERKTRAEVEDLRQQLKKLQESKREERKKLADEDAQIKIKKLEEQAYVLQRQVASQKQEEEALLNEMEVTGQAFEDMQEQNSRLIQQLREKDDANFKLMTERIKSNQLHKLAREEKDVLKEQVSTLTTQVEAANVVVRKLEEKERLLQNSLATVEKELALRQQAMEMHKRKAIESAQSAADLKLHLEKYHSQMKEAQQVVAEKTSSLEAEAYKTKRLQEEIAQLRRKVERMKKIELAETLDEVMAEELREYKETLTCPSCKVKRKDAVLTKCVHVFCWDCLRTRYETRQRKCPKCNCAFGANDYHRLYLST